MGNKRGKNQREEEEESHQIKQLFFYLICIKHICLTNTSKRKKMSQMKNTILSMKIYLGICTDGSNEIFPFNLKNIYPLETSSPSHEIGQSILKRV